MARVPEDYVLEKTRSSICTSAFASTDLVGAACGRAVEAGVMLVSLAAAWDE